MNKETMTYDSAYEELEQILNSLQNDEIGIDDLSINVKRALEIISYCKSRLKITGEEIEKMLEQ